MIREELFNTSFNDNGDLIIQKFKSNFQRLQEFMRAIDKEIGSLQVFN
jgi:hypothetical protein